MPTALVWDNAQRWDGPQTWDGWLDGGGPPPADTTPGRMTTIRFGTGAVGAASGSAATATATGSITTSTASGGSAVGGMS